MCVSSLAIVESSYDNQKDSAQFACPTLSKRELIQQKNAPSGI